MEKIKEILAQTFRIKVEDIKEDTTINDIDTWDSLTHMELVVNLEQGLGVEFEGDEIVEMTSIEAIIKFVSNKK